MHSRFASSHKFTPCVLAAIISVLCVANAKAVPITYTESATVSGTLTPVSGPVITFTDAQLTLTGTGDTAHVPQDDHGGRRRRRRVQVASGGGIG